MGLAIVGREKERHLVSIQDWGLSARIAQSCYGIWFYPIKTVLPLGHHGVLPGARTDGIARAALPAEHARRRWR